METTLVRRVVVPTLWLATSLSTASAGVPGPRETAGGVPCEPTIRSVWMIAASPAACQHRFRIDGGMDALRVILTLRDCFDAPVGGCPVKATVAPAPGTPAFCACEPLEQVRETDASGYVDYTFRRIGGRGSAEVRLTLLCMGGGGGTYGFPPLDFEFTSPDLNGSCEPGSSTTVIDLGLWASGLYTYRQSSDFDCNGTVDVIDLGLWAGGLGVGCPAGSR